MRLRNRPDGRLPRGERAGGQPRRRHVRGAPQLSRNLPADYPAGRPLGNCDVVEAAVDMDGLVVRAWAGQRSSPRWA